MIRNAYHIVLLVVFLVLLPGCTKESGSITEKDDTVAIPLSLSVSKVSPQTKMTDAIVQGSNPAVFRGIDQVYIIPFKIAGNSVTASDKRWGGNLSLPQTGLPANTFGDDADGGSFDGLVSNSNSHLYETVFVRMMTNAALVYGKALDESIDVVDANWLSYKRRNGVLNHTDFSEVRQPSEITFSLEPFLSTTALQSEYTTWRQKLVNSYLNPIVSASATNKNVKPNVTYRFHTPEGYNNHPTLVAAFNEFTNEGRLMSGSYDVLEKKLTALYRSVYLLSTDKHNSLGYNVGTYYYVYELARDIISKINKSDYVTISGSGVSATVSLKIKAPGSFGLPHGAFPLQYREGSKAFGETLNTISGIGTVSHKDFCYPPSLWYYANSRLLTTSDASVVDYYNSATGSWGNILSHYGASFVMSDSESAAIKDPLQYGVARMSVKIGKTTSNTLKDFDGNSVSVNNTNYPLTGIVIEGQKPVDYSFNPVSSSTDNLYIYDADVYNGTSPKAYISYNTNSSNVSVLVLQTEEARDVHFALEFVNNSKTAFYGANSCAVYPGNHFYLVGVLEYSTAQNTTGEDISSVFCQDRVTSVNISVSNLKNAYTVVPDLREPQLLLGVEAQLNWDMTTPGTVVIK
ncbi:MAG: hypothetical protein IJ543_06745 [Bacteroidales bacterium]|nr:hypothetical protein [Bacteroidales bacterium]